MGTVKCIIDDEPNKWGRYMEGVPIVGGRDDILVSVEKYHINEILLAIPTASPEQRRDILDICKETGCGIKTLLALSDGKRRGVYVSDEAGSH